MAFRSFMYGDIAIYPAEMLIDQTRLMKPSGKDIPKEEAANYMVIVSGHKAFNYITYDKFIMSIFHSARSLGGVISDKGGYILTTKGYRIKQKANRMAGQIQ